LLVVIPRIDLIGSDEGNYEFLGSLQFTPPINDQWSLYSRAEGLYELSLDGSEHQRSYVSGRAGLGYKEFAFGLGLNVDYFGPAKDSVTNIGIFLRADLF